MAKRNAVYAQSGGVTSVINASAYGLIHATRSSGAMDAVYAGLDGINGVLEENLIDLGQEAPEAIEALRYTPAGAFGSCRKKLQDVRKNEAEFQRILDVLGAHDVHYFFYNGGNDSMDTVAKLSGFAKSQGYPLQVIGIPKTIDNDLPITDNCPGFGSVAKYNAISMMEASLDTASMSKDSTKVFVMETMGRHAGWIAAATGLASRTPDEGPHIILLPEVPFDANKFCNAVTAAVKKSGHCAVTVSEGLQDQKGNFLSEMGTQDAFGHAQLGGVGSYIQELVKRELKLKVHGAVLDYCQRSARHIASQVDAEQAMACGAKAVKLAEEGLTGVLPVIQRDSQSPYRWSLGHADAGKIANQEKMLPKEFIREDGYHITDGFRAYCAPLIQGEDYPPYHGGLPRYAHLKRALLPKKLPPFAKAKAQ